MESKRTTFISAVIVFAVISALAYITIRAVLLFFVDYDLLEMTLAILLIAGESFVILHSLGYVFNVFKALGGKKAYNAARYDLKTEPSVAILIPARHEPKEVLEQTFATINNIDYKNKQVYFLDDSSDERYVKEADELAKSFNLNLFRRAKRHGAKAGIINDCLKALNQKYIAVFDADQNPMPDFLKTLIPILESDEKLAFIQTPQFYTNIDESYVARGAAFQQSIFYEYICEGKNTSRAMFCCGTNIIFRRNALLDVGGLNESSVTEDFATSVKFHTRKWKSLYYNHVNTFGMAPKNLKAYFRQQFRWSVGTITVFKNLLLRLFTRPFSLKPMQWWEYMLSSTYYLVGAVFFVLMICPVVFLLFNIPSFFAEPRIYFLAFLPYIIFSMSLFYTLLRVRNYTPKDLVLGQLLGAATFSIYIRGALTAFTGVKIKFGITEKVKSKSIPYIQLWPQMLFILLNFIAVVWGINRFINELEPAILVNSFWALYHFAILSSVFYFNHA